MTVSSVSSTTGTSSTASTSSSTSGSSTSVLNTDFNTYLKILTTQLKNQDPTNATDPNQYTQELIQIEGVQQQIATDTDLKSLVSAESSKSLASGIGYIGNYVESNSTAQSFALQSSSSEFGYTLPSTASSVGITVSDSTGKVVDAFSGGTASGANLVSWNGKDSSGNQLSDGTYTFAVTAIDASGASLTVSKPVVFSKINGVQSNSDGTLSLMAGGLSVSSSDVTAVYPTGSLPTATASNASSSTSG